MLFTITDKEKVIQKRLEKLTACGDPFRETLKNAAVIEKLFNRFERYLGKSGFDAKAGTIIDASIISAPKQRNSRDDNQLIKEGKILESFENNVYRLRQKDVDARWTKKKQNYFD